MPSYVTYHIFAATVQRVTSDSVAHIASSYPAAYRWGSQGPDPLALYHAPFPSALRRLANRVCTEPPAPLFESLCKAAVASHNTAALAYVFGFCTHYALSRVTYSFVSAQADRLSQFMPGYSAEARRHLVESDIDGVMIAAQARVRALATSSCPTSARLTPSFTLSAASTTRTSCMLKARSIRPVTSRPSTSS